MIIAMRRIWREISFRTALVRVRWDVKGKWLEWSLQAFWLVILCSILALMITTITAN